MFLHLSVILFTGWWVGFPACITGHMTSGGPGGSVSGGEVGQTSPRSVYMMGGV